jgi:hypothetical protein
MKKLMAIAFLGLLGWSCFTSTANAEVIQNTDPVWTTDTTVNDEYFYNDGLSHVMKANDGATVTFGQDGRIFPGQSGTTGIVTLSTDNGGTFNLVGNPDWDPGALGNGDTSGVLNIAGGVDVIMAHHFGIRNNTSNTTEINILDGTLTLGSNFSFMHYDSGQAVATIGAAGTLVVPNLISTPGEFTSTYCPDLWGNGSDFVALQAASGLTLQFVQDAGTSTTTITAVPEPGTIALLAAGLLGMVAFAWRKR